MCYNNGMSLKEKMSPTFKARLHCATHCLTATMATCSCWLTGSIIGQFLAGAAISITLGTVAPAAMVGLAIGFATLPTYIIVITK